ncbi:MAG: lysoplasmalogenase [Thermoguttaceae bacterium]|nr:lysoplasmalogenase [Thermoguttaceae bacterium]
MTPKTRIVCAAAGLAIAATVVAWAAFTPATWAKNSVATLTCAAIVVARGLAAGRPRRGGTLVWAIAAGLAASVVGDWFMNARGDDERLFLCGIGAFFAAHVCFLTGFLSRLASVRRFAAFGGTAFALGVAYFACRLAGDVPGVALKIASFSYLAVSVASLAAAFAVDLRGGGRWAAFLGIASIFGSDVIIAERVFLGVQGLGGWIIPTYLAAHFGLTAAVLLDAAAPRA